MKSLLLALLLVAVTAGAPTAANELPWTKFSVQAGDAVSSGLGACPDGQEVFFAQFERDGKAYLSAYGINSDKYFIVEYAGTATGSPATRYGVGLVDMVNAHDDIPPLVWTIVPPDAPPSLDVCALLRVDLKA